MFDAELYGIIYIVYIVYIFVYFIYVEGHTAKLVFFWGVGYIYIYYSITVLLRAVSWLPLR